MQETELYSPVRQYLEEIGYVVSAEVKGCDIAARRGEHLIVVELKTGANLKLLIQATDRKQVADAVYVAFPEPRRRTKHVRGVERILKLLGLGLITVRFGPMGATATARIEPGGTGHRPSARRRNAVIEEIDGRSMEHNTGGSTRTKLVTAYRERAIFIACCLDRYGPMALRQLADLGVATGAGTLLASNHYGWFERVSRGVYAITDAGRQGIDQFPALRDRARALLESAASPLTD